VTTAFINDVVLIALAALFWAGMVADNVVNFEDARVGEHWKNRLGLGYRRPPRLVRSHSPPHMQQNTPSCVARSRCPAFRADSAFRDHGS
jgi:hypothetical protein